MESETVAIIGGGNIGRAITEGLVRCGAIDPTRIVVTRRQVELINDLAGMGVSVQNDNLDALKRSNVIIIAVRPRQLKDLLEGLRPELEPGRHMIISVVSGIDIREIRGIVGNDIPIIRAMPNLAASICESMTCLAAEKEHNDALSRAAALFDNVGHTLVIDEELIVPATAVCACGVAFFFRAIRAASQGGIEVGFHSEEALEMAAQTAKGAASLLINGNMHPEAEIDKVTTPRGCTIAGLNKMEEFGFSSAMIKGMRISAEKAEELVNKD
ncbi:MAG: pyrroline-5-carboxylate reductase [Candidatus Proteinoplasmatales archaeon SG8-5]|nr:MAG: pyrroline-5-carboxylate reductase [Candidatus Proteinoplasmatales archaeon SG8-5]